MILLLRALQSTPVERCLAEENPAARGRILRTITASVDEVERQLRTPAPRPAAAETGLVVRKKLKADHPEGGEFEYVLWVPKSYTPDRQWRMIINLHGSGGNGDGALRRWLKDLQQADDTDWACPTLERRRFSVTGRTRVQRSRSLYVSECGRSLCPQRRRRLVCCRSS